ncbi:hypothetical protein C5167_046826 [Papaver somniferum]|uniref:Uncharacterized protein n=1 Tax=Papaver somniferum TaxID=3469 RepID=A0A4Y7LIM4_PAPSO|nr:hypothetical protein C5167_046826 [Papaver somniferum]
MKDILPARHLSIKRPTILFSLFRLSFLREQIITGIEHDRHCLPPFITTREGNGEQQQDKLMFYANEIFEV